MDNIGLFFLIFGLSNQSEFLNDLMIFGARFLIYLAILLSIFLAFKDSIKEKKALILSIISLPVIVILIKIIHLFFFEPRPFVSFHLSPLIPYGQDASFPSRHVAIMSAIALALTFYKSKWAPIFLLFTLWVGIARIYVGVHYPLDILGGFLLGLISLAVAVQIKKYLQIYLRS